MKAATDSPVVSIDPRTPLIFEPKITPAIWGGDALVRRYGKAGDSGTTLGESWECWDENSIMAASRTGETLTAVRARLGSLLMGPLDPTQCFPVLTKIIDAHAPLSVQVHPDDAYAQRVEGQPFGKTECWYVLDAAPGADLVLGWTHDTDRAEVERRVAAGTLGDLLRRVPARAGDAFYVPAGTVHSIGAGIQLLEVEQASDLTYRLFDWNRVGADGVPRRLDVAKAADVLVYREMSTGAVQQLNFSEGGCVRTVSIADQRFAVERWAFGRAGATVDTGGRPMAIMAADTPLQLTAGDGASLAPWQTAIVPAVAGQVHLGAAVPGAAFIIRAVPDLVRLRADAAHAGVDAPTLDGFFRQFL